MVQSRANSPRGSQRLTAASPLSDLTARVHQELAWRARSVGLDPESLRVEYVLNWGGFVNESFRVIDAKGKNAYHLKLASEPDQRAKLRRWRGVHELLESRYRAPRFVEAIAIPDAGREGLLFDLVHGAAPPRMTKVLAERLLPLLDALHGDDELRAVLEGPRDPLPCRDTFLGTYIDRFREDLIFVAGKRPAFVSGATLDWLGEEAAALEDAARTSPAFDEPATSPIHADLWLDNLLVTPDDELFVLDWDELRIGDAVLDFAMLFGPNRRTLRAEESCSWFDPTAKSVVWRQRFALYARAALFDWILDPLADYVAADVAPAHAPIVRAEKERIHRAALAQYRKTYA